MSSAPRPAWLSWAGFGNGAVLFALLLLAVWMAGWQGGDWWLATPRDERWFAGVAVLLGYAGGWAWLAARQRRDARPQGDAPAAIDAVRVIHASQTGFAQVLATRTADSLRAAGLPVLIQPIDAVRVEDLREGRALFVVSTTGEGDPPDPALGFVRQVMSQPAPLAGLHYAVLALGDREYVHFCAFGQQLDDWLRQHGAQPLFDRVDVDNADESALRHWQHHLGQLGGVTDLPDWDAPRYEAWRLRERRCLNPGSVGEPAFHLSLQPADGPLPQWHAGDIAEIGPRNPAHAVAAFAQAAGWDGEQIIHWRGQATRVREALAQIHLPAADSVRGRPAEATLADLPALPHREYSIASVPREGDLCLLVRRMRRPDGTPGLGSGWLCEYAEVGGPISLRIRENANFHPPAMETPLILVGNGTGIAGLRAHLQARAASGARRNWLLFGERQAAHDFFYRDEITAWQAQGLLARVDLAFSRDQARRIYVQDVLREAADELRHWVDEGAAIYVCGSLEGMAPGVDAVLRQALGEDALEDLRLAGRYRRDVY